MEKKKIAVDINAHITNVKCEIDNSENMITAKISFENLAFGNITAVKFNATGYNSFGDIVQINGKDKFFLIIQDINVGKNEIAKDLRATLPNSDIRRLELEECQICYSDGSVSNYSVADVKEFDTEVIEQNGEMLRAIREIVSPDVKYKPVNTEDGWLCSCGRYNAAERDDCSKCGVRKSEILKLALDSSYGEILAKYRENIEKEEEKERQERLKKEKENKRRNVKIWIGIVVGIVLSILIGYGMVMSGRATYSSEDEMMLALQGIYTCYDEDGDAKYRLRIVGDTVYKRFCGLGSDHDHDYEVTSWNYKKGTVDLTYGSFIATSSGDIKYDENLYKKGGSWPETEENALLSSIKSSIDSGKSDLKVTVDSVSSNSSYTICKGSVKNNGDKTYEFIEVKGSFKDEDGEVIDTDWTYVVGSEGLASGESSSFRLSVPKNSKIKSCSVKVIDYD